MLRILTPPKTPKEAIASRRNPCYGFAIIACLGEYLDLITILEDTKQEILKLIDPEITSKKAPIRSPLYIKQKFFHAAVFGPPPLLDEQQFFEIYANKDGLLNPSAMDSICKVLHAHLTEQQPFLEFIKCELMTDGTILARFAYKTKSSDDIPLLTLASQLDPQKKLAQWDSSNRLRYTTVTVALCVIDTDKLGDKIKPIQERLIIATEKIKKLGNLTINHFQMISRYNKRTFSFKHIQLYADISTKDISKVCLSR